MISAYDASHFSKRVNKSKKRTATAPPQLHLQWLCSILYVSLCRCAHSAAFGLSLDGAMNQREQADIEMNLEGHRTDTQLD